jgi:hypothetical protein
MFLQYTKNRVTIYLQVLSRLERGCLSGSDNPDCPKFRKLCPNQRANRVFLFILNNKNSFFNLL